jgi:hypothetical protein
MAGPAWNKKSKRPLSPVMLIFVGGLMDKTLEGVGPW